MKHSAARIALLVLAAAAPCQTSAQNPCSIITKAEAEALVAGKLEGPQLSPGGTLCKYLEPGYAEDPRGKKLVTIGVFRQGSADPEAVNKRRQFILQDQSLLPVTNRDVPNIGDAAIWVWAGGYFGALYAFKEGKTEVAVKISGIREPAALAAARRFAARALGGSTGTGYRYASSGTSVIADNYNAPRILGPLYLGTFDPIPDDEISRNYVISLVEVFDKSCEKVPETMAVLNYGFYYAMKANNQVFASAAANKLEQGFASVLETMHRAEPHMLQMGYDDAARFLKQHAQGEKCFTAPVEQLYNNIARLAVLRRRMPPDVPNYAHFLEMLSPAARAQYRGGFEGQPTPEAEKQLQKIKRGCLEFTKGAALSMEAFCRCHSDAAKEARLSSSDLDLLGGNFSNEAAEELGKREPEYGRRKNACYT